MEIGFDSDWYQERAGATAGSHEDILLYTALGLGGEAGEVLDLVKKLKFHDHPYDKEKFKEELGDVAWYLAMACTAHGLLLSEVMEANLSKLANRYPNGFTSERSINRATTD